MASEEVIELSVDETNALRLKLGLTPLRSNQSRENDEGHRVRKADVHLPAPNQLKDEATKSRINEIKLAREVKTNLKNKFSQSSLAFNNPNNDEEGNDVLSWAERMRRKTSKSKSDSKSESQSQRENTYTSQDLQGIRVAHSVSSFQTNKKTILTLADESILQQNENKITTGLNENHESRLENIEISGSTKAKENLRKRRRIEMGQGHAGGYAAWDDEEFDEMGGIGNTNLDIENDNMGQSSSFIIGNSDNLEKYESEKKESIFGSKVKISLEASNKENKLATDFLTVEEYEEQKKSNKKKKNKKEKGFKKMKKNKKKDLKNKNRRKKLEDELSEDDNNTQKKKKTSLLDDLVSTAIDVSHVPKARPRIKDELNETMEHVNNDNKSEIKSMDEISSSGTVSTMNKFDDDVKKMQAKRAKFDAVMEKGNIRSKQAFQNTNADSSNVSAEKNSIRSETQSTVKEESVEDETDDAFLNAALAKARRLQKLKKLVKKDKNDINKEIKSSKGEDAKAKAILNVLESSKRSEHEENQNEDKSLKNNESKETGITFEFDPTREFTRALRARASQNQRQMKIKLKNSQPTSNATNKSEKSENTIEPSILTNVDISQEEELTKLAQEISDENDDKIQSTTNTDGLNFTSQSNLLVNRGLSSTLSLLKTTGSLASYDTKNSFLQEKLRGRAKDYRNYEDYESLNLSEVTSIGSSRDLKDKEFTKREVKLEYRDEFGRLLTSKEAYRQMCYQFHGHGSGKKNEERRMKLIERERMEVGGGSAVGAGVGKREGTLGALKATQRVTGKAFIVHKT